MRHQSAGLDTGCLHLLCLITQVIAPYSAHSPNVTWAHAPSWLPVSWLGFPEWSIYLRPVTISMCIPLTTVCGLGYKYDLSLFNNHGSQSFWTRLWLSCWTSTWINMGQGLLQLSCQQMLDLPRSSRMNPIQRWAEPRKRLTDWLVLILSKPWTQLFLRLDLSWTFQWCESINSLLLR